MSKIQLTILGLGQIGASLGLALKAHTDQVTRVGNDLVLEAARKAEKLGAVDQVQINLHTAVEKADLVVLALPPDQVRETLAIIASDLKDGAVVLDCSPMSRSAAQWAQELLPEGRHFVSFCPTVNPAYLMDSTRGVNAAHEDLFANSLIYLAAPPTTDPDAVKLAADLATLVGSKPVFSDAHELDGLLAAHYLLPRLAAAALINATVDEPGWPEGRKIAGISYAGVTHFAEEQEESKNLGKSALENSDNLVRVLNNLIAALIHLRDAIQSQDEEKVHSWLKHAQESRLTWWEQRLKSNWVSTSAEPLPSSTQILGGLFGFRPRDKKRGPGQS